MKNLKLYGILVVEFLSLFFSRRIGMIMFNLLFILFVFSCKKDDPPLPPESPGAYENGILVLNEGLFQQNNSSISFYNLANQQVYTQCFLTENNRGLGDTGNDFEKYNLNGKDYVIIAVDISSQIEIVEANTLKSVAQIPLFDGTNAREPRRIEVYGMKAFVCNFDGTVSVIDLISNSVVKTITVGANPDGMVQVANKLYVSNSGGLNYPVYDSTITIIDMNTNNIIENFETRINSSSMIVDSQNEIYLLSSGNYADINPALVRINTTTNQVDQLFDIPIGSMTKVGDWIYYYNLDSKKVMRINLITENLDATIILDCADYETFSGLQYNAELNLLFCFDANGYVNSTTVRCYATSGVFQYEFMAELNSKKIICNE